MPSEYEPTITADHNPPAGHHTRASVLMDLMRGLAATLVLLSHWRDLLFVPYAQASRHSPFVVMFYLLTGAGHQAVIVFFVLSGYLITSAVIRARQAGRWTWASYIENRLARLWTVLIPALVLVVALDFIGAHLARSAPLYTGIHSENVLINAAQHLTVPVLLGNIAFLQQILVPPFGSDSPLWSISYEFWYYILFPLALLSFWGIGRWLQRTFYLVLFLLIARLVGRDVLLLFPIWLMGSALNYLPRSKRRPLPVVCIALIYFAVFLAAAPTHSNLLPYFTGIASTGMIWLLLGFGDRAPTARWVDASRLLARFSYSLYVVHCPLLVLLTGLWIGLDRRQPGLLMVLKGFPLVLIAMAFSYAFARCTEFHTDQVRRWFRYLHPAQP